MFSQVRSLAADRVSPPVSKRQNNHLVPSCRLSFIKKIASTSLATIGARSSFSGARLAHEFPRSFLVAAIIFPHTKWLKKITDYRDTPALSRRDFFFNRKLDMSFSEADRMELDSTYSSSRKWDFLPGSFREGRRFDWRSMAIYRFVMTWKKI